MFTLDWISQVRHRAAVLMIGGLIVLLIGVLDWRIRPHNPGLALLYLLPIMLAAGFLPRWAIVLLGAACAVLAEASSSPGPLFMPVRLAVMTLALAGCGLFVGELLRSRRRSMEYGVRLKALLETSPAAIVTVDEGGSIELANRAAVDLMVPGDGDLTGHPIAVFLPDLHNALRRKDAPQPRRSLQCQAHRGNGELFDANVWFSTYKEGPTPKLTAIIEEAGDRGEPELKTAAAPAPPSTPNSDSPEPAGQAALNGRETAVLRLVVQGLANKEISAKLTISEGTVKHTLQQLFAKTGVRTRGQLVRVALEQHRSTL